MKTFIKQPNDVLDYDIDLSAWLPTDDYLASASITITGADSSLEAGPDDFPEYSLTGSPADTAKIWLGGGTDDVRYKVTVQITTNDGRVKEHEFYIKVKNL